MPTHDDPPSQKSIDTLIWSHPVCVHFAKAIDHNTNQMVRMGMVTVSCAMPAARVGVRADLHESANR
jgi:hypothetical protein